MAATAQAMAARSLRSMARASHAPIPGRVILVSPTEIASDATMKNQLPDIDIIAFQTSPGTAKGASRRTKRCQGESRKWRVTSVRSRGRFLSDW